MLLGFRFGGFLGDWMGLGAIPSQGMASSMEHLTRKDVMSTVLDSSPAGSAHFRFPDLGVWRCLESLGVWCR